MSSSATFADDSVVDEISITVPVSCSMSGTGMNSHTATLVNGTYTPDIGTTTLHAFCNDSEGFAIYAAGYTGNDIGTTNSNKLVGTSASNNATIDTGIATSAGNPDVSNWAMKLTATQDSGDTSGTNAFTIDSVPNTSGGANASFSQYHVVPNEYTKVAHKNSATDMTASTGGVKLTTTYAAYISKTQVADTYTGQVIYTLVHPSDTDAPVTPSQVGINFHGNGLTFPGGATKNRVIYGPVGEDYYVTVDDEYVVAKSNNVDNSGNLTSSYPHTGEDQSDYANVTDEDAELWKIDISYNLGNEGSRLHIGGCIFDSDSYECTTSFDNNSYYIESGAGDHEEVYYVKGNRAYISLDFSGISHLDGNTTIYFYAKAYPMHYAGATDEGAEYYETLTVLSPTAGTYAETTTWNGKWYGEIPYEYEDCYWDDDLGDEVCEVISGTNMVYFEDEDEIIDYLNNNESLFGTTVELYAYNPYIIYYNGNGATAGTMSGFYTALDDNTSSSTADLMAYNFKKTGYGFAGWSADQNATINGNSKIYGPNEKIVGNELTFDNNREATLYAVWAPSAGNLQGWSGCSSMTIGQVTALTDTRDNNVYTVGKLADGNCWMMENLRLDAANSSDSTKAQGFGGVFTGLADSEDDSFGTTTANGKYNTSNITDYYQENRFPRYNNNNTNIGGTNASGATLKVSPGFWNAAGGWDSQNSDYGDEDRVQWYGYGNYYSWAAAMANTEELTGASYSESADTSICPTGWRLPYGNSYTGQGISSGGFSYLDIQLGGTGEDQYEYDGEGIVSNRWRSYPNNFIYSGAWSYDASGGRGDYGFYHSCTVSGGDGYGVNALTIRSDQVGFGISVRYTGGSVRCLTQ